MFTYPDYILQMLARACYEGQWQAGQADAAALCFNVLALFPDCAEASELAYELFCDEWTIYDNRVAIQRNIDEWDDRPWQQRRRLALSFRFMSRWQGWEHEYLEGYEHEKDDQSGEPADWVKRQERLFSGELPDEMIQDMLQRHRWTRNIPPPSTPKCYDPDEPPFDPSAHLGAEDDDAA